MNDKLNFRLDYSKLEGFGEIKLQGKSGNIVECIVIPKEINHIFSSEKGGRYQDFVCFPTPDSEYGSHMVVVSKTKEEQEHEKQTGERIYKTIVGNLKPFGNSQASAGEEYSLPNQTAAQQVAQTAKSRKAEMTNDMHKFYQKGQQEKAAMKKVDLNEESAAAALRASLTGHLVFATLHSGSPAEAVFRLEKK